MEPNNAQSSKHLDKNNNPTCSCSNISIMQLFHEMKQNFPTVPDHIVSQLVTENCHQRELCVNLLSKESQGHTISAQIYPSHSIHPGRRVLGPINNTGVNSSTTIGASANTNLGSTLDAKESIAGKQCDSSIAMNAKKIGLPISSNKRPTTLPIAKENPSSLYPLLRKAPAPPQTPSPKKTSDLSNQGKTGSPSISSISPSQSPKSHPPILQQIHQHQQQQQVLFDSSATKCNDSLNVQLNVTVSPISGSAPPIPPRPLRHISCLNVQPDPPYTSMLEQNVQSTPQNSQNFPSGQKSYTSVNFTLRQPTSIIPNSHTPIDIQAGPSSLTYSSSSFDAKKGYQSHLKITVAGNGESCVSAVRTKNDGLDLRQIDTSIDVGGTGKVAAPINIITPQRSNEDEILLIKQQLRQKEVIDCELRKEKEKLETIKLEIISMMQPVLSTVNIEMLKQDIVRLRCACERLTQELDAAGVPILGDSIAIQQRPPRPPPPIPAALRCLSLHRHYSSANDQLEIEDPPWPCKLCTFQNNALLKNCEQCDMPRFTGNLQVNMAASPSRPPIRLQHMQYQQSAAESNPANPAEIKANNLCA